MLLSINVNKIATLRNARGGDVPNLVQYVETLQEKGVRGITVHPRPDERHITAKDVHDLARCVSGEFNIEGYPNERLIGLVKEVKPTQCTLVPDPPDAITSNAGWQVHKNREFLKDVVAKLRDVPNLRISIFIDPFDYSDEDNLAVSELGIDRIELYTESYAKNLNEVLPVYQKAALMAKEKNIGINAGHDLNSKNLELFLSKIPDVQEVSIGHAFVCESLYLGLEETLKRYRSICD